MRWPCLRLATVVAAAWLATAAGAQDVRLERLENELIVRTPGRTGACDVLLFTPNGEQLLACGDDKVVRVWNFNERTGLDTEPASARTLRWSAYREARGGLYAMAVLPERPDARAPEVVVGGQGLRSGAVAVLDFNGDVPFAVTKVRKEDTLKQSTIWALGCSKSGRLVAYGDSAGGVWLWDLKGDAGRPAPPRRLGAHEHPDWKPDSKPPRFNYVRLIAFLDEDRLISAAADGTVFLWQTDRDSAKPEEVFRFKTVSDLRCVAYDPVNRRLAAGGQSNDEGKKRLDAVEVRSLKGDGGPLDLPQGGLRNYPMCLAFDAAGERLAVGCYSQPKGKTFNNIVGGRVFLFDLTERAPKAAPGPKSNYYPEALAFHPKGKHLAVAGGDDHEVSVFSLADLDKPISVIAGPGQCLWSVGVSRDFSLLGFRAQRDPDCAHPNRRGKGAWQVFDLKKRGWAAPDQVKAFEPIPPLERSARGWTIEFDESKGTVWYVVSPGGKSYPLPLDPIRDWRPRCYTFLNAVDDKPERVAVGHLWGVSVFALTDKGPKLMRKAVGCQGEVMAVAPSPDHKYLLTAGRDQAVSCFSLADWKYQSELGAAFKEKGDGLVVTDVDRGSPAWEAHLQVGDEVARFAYGTEEVKGEPKEWLPKLKLKDRQEAERLEGLLTEAGPKAWLKILNDPKPGLECYFVNPKDAKKNLPPGKRTTVRQEPSWRFFPMRVKNTREWILWLQPSFYYDCSTNGDFYVGWQLSGEVDRRPVFHAAEQFRTRFYRPDKVALLVPLARDVDAASIVDIEPPLVTVDPPPPGRVRDASFKVMLKAEAAGQRGDHELTRVNLWVNDLLVETFDASGRSFTKEATVRARDLRRGKNLVIVQAYNKAGVRGQTMFEVENVRDYAAPILHGVVIGVGAYDEKKTGLPALNAQHDAQALFDAWNAQKGKLYREVKLTLLRDQDATRARVEKALDEIREKAGPDDHVLIVLAGHGASAPVIKAAARGLYNKEPEEKLDPYAFVFCTFDFNVLKPESTGLTSGWLYEKIKKLPGRKVLLIDACRSGSREEDPIRRLTPEGVGPLVFSACARDQDALEVPKIGKNLTGKAVYGLFTTALLLALDDEFGDVDADHNGKLDARELKDYLSARVPEMLKTVKTDKNQNPTAFLPPRETLLPLAQK